MEPDKIRKHILQTYVSLRYGLAFIAFTFPIVLYLRGKSLDIGLQDSLSAYYHAGGEHHDLRNLFVGFLFAIGAGLHLYKGYSERENLALNIAGLSAVGVAFFPMKWEKTGSIPFPGIEWSIGKLDLSVHGFFAVLMFLCVAYVCIKCSEMTIGLMSKPERMKRYRMMYRGLGVGMLGLPVVAVIMTILVGKGSKWIFVVEAAAIYAFCMFWLVKSREIKDTEKLAASGNLELSRK